MLRLLVISSVLAAVFASTFLLARVTGFMTLDNITSLLVFVSELDAMYVGGLIAILLFMDMFIAVPTLTVVTLAGYFLGPLLGGVFSVAGMLSAGLCGYWICRRWGEGLLLKIYKDPLKLKQMREVFNAHGGYVLILCRAAPILPEVACCLAGGNRMPFKKFMMAYSLGTVPYALLASYAGAQSSLDDPLPGVMSAVGISVLLWGCWVLLIRAHSRAKPAIAE